MKQYSVDPKLRTKFRPLKTALCAYTSGKVVVQFLGS